MAFRRAFLLLALLALPMALAQETTPVLLERTDGRDLVADVDEPAFARFYVFNLNPTDDFHVRVEVSGPKHWESSVDTGPFFLDPRTATNITIELRPLDTPRADAVFEVTFTFVHGATGTATRVTQKVEVASGAAPRVLGLFPNPLPAPFDNAYGTFLVDMLFWAAVGFISVLASKWTVKLVMWSARSETTRDVLQKLQRPIFFLVLLLGLSQSFAVLPRNPLTVGISKFLIALAVTGFGLYVIYRILEAFLLYYQREIAPKTETKMDDVLVPALRKVGLIVIYAIGIVLTLRNLGWDPTIIFAGAGIAGLVIAFAAQDTFSNLFSGIFLLLDRPFVEGDQIRLESGDDAIVENIGLRTTRLYSEKIHETIIVPNNQLATRRIINHSAPNRLYRVSIEVGVSYGSDPRHIERVLLAVARAHPENIEEGRFRPTVRFQAFQDSALQFAVRLYVIDFTNRGRVSSDIHFAIVEAFRREGIEIPFPQRVVHMQPQ